jgi:signal peptidase II
MRQGILRGRVFAIMAGLAFIVLEQWVKALAFVALQSSRFKFGGDFLGAAFELSLNPGAFLSVGAGLPVQVKQAIFIIGVLVFVVWAIYWALSRWTVSIKQAVPIYVIALGGASNLIDRVFREGHVVDYLILNLGPIHTGVFNLADVAITGGALLLLLDVFSKKRIS